MPHEAVQVASRRAVAVVELNKEMADVITLYEVVRLRAVERWPLLT